MLVIFIILKKDSHFFFPFFSLEINILLLKQEDCKIFEIKQKLAERLWWDSLGYIDYVTSYLHFSYLNNICIDSLLAGDDVGLHHLHHGVLKVHLPFTSSNNPWVPEASLSLFKPPLYTST